jgi:hypothetical protein
MHLFCIIFSRLYVWQGVLSVPKAAVVRDHRDLLYVAVRNEYQDIRHWERNYLGHFLLIIFRSIVSFLQLCSQLC